MHALWYGLVSGMLAVYVTLDGFDFGAGMLHRLVARTDAERRQVLAAIGPVWDGNEVWIIAAGGTLFFAFPDAYAAGFSGFYLPLIILLWLLILRGLAVELRSHEPHPLWRSFWDTTLQFASLLIVVFLGAAFGNLLRGVPVDASGWFHLPLFTDFRPTGPDLGILDYYTVTAALWSVAIVALHGATFLAWKTEGPVRERALAFAGRLWWTVIGVGVVATFLTWRVHPGFFGTIIGRGWPMVPALLAVAGLAGVRLTLRGPRHLLPFVSSAGLIVGILAATAAALFPNMLTSTVSPAFSITARSAAADPASLRLGLLWWIPGMALATAYNVYVYGKMRGKVGG